ncbi:MAG: hypothetical protein J7J25_04245 [Candidatus Omnitrophica bacterium]|nr:hypothetical protein [Candidatus Omnitrophota bacterium]
MGRKPKFRPRVTRIKLNPEQAVLWCTCYWAGRTIHATPGGRYRLALSRNSHFCSAGPDKYLVTTFSSPGWSISASSSVVSS